jgi:hypothetical protein
MICYIKRLSTKGILSSFFSVNYWSTILGLVLFNEIFNICHRFRSHCISQKHIIVNRTFSRTLRPFSAIHIFGFSYNFVKSWNSLGLFSKIETFVHSLWHIHILDDSKQISKCEIQSAYQLV